jgi:thioredoxin reductase
VTGVQGAEQRAGQYARLMGDVPPEILGAVSGSPVIVYGGGKTGCETAEFIAARGLQVKLVTRSALNELARSAEPIYRRQLRSRLGVIPIPCHEVTKAEGSTAQLREHKERMVPGICVKAFQASQQASTICS